MTPRSPDQNKEIREQSRGQIKDAAFELFAQNGFANTSVSSIAKKAGISKGLIYHYFQSKDDILQALFDDLAAMGDQAMNFPDGISAQQKLELVLETIFHFIRESTETTRLMMSLALQPEAMAKLKASIDRYNEEQIKRMTPIFESLGYDDPTAEAYFLAAKMDGITLGYITLGEDYPFETMKQKVIDDYVSQQEK